MATIVTATAKTSILLERRFSREPLAARSWNFYRRPLSAFVFPYLGNNYCAAELILMSPRTLAGDYHYGSSYFARELFAYLSSSFWNFLVISFLPIISVKLGILLLKFPASGDASRPIVNLELNWIQQKLARGAAGLRAEML